MGAGIREGAPRGAKRAKAGAGFTRLSDFGNSGAGPQACASESLQVTGQVLLRLPETDLKAEAPIGGIEGNRRRRDAIALGAVLHRLNRRSGYDTIDREESASIRLLERHWARSARHGDLQDREARPAIGTQASGE